MKSASRRPMQVKRRSAKLRTLHTQQKTQIQSRTLHGRKSLTEEPGFEE
ncbi:MAG: hypothetical protein AAFV07_18465 [Bacteroidota bacterium]